MLELASGELGRYDTVGALFVTGFSVRALGRSGFVVSPSPGWLDGSAGLASLLLVAGAASAVTRAEAFVSLEVVAGFTSAGLAPSLGSSFASAGLTTRGAGTPISVPESERAAGTGELGDTGGLLALPARAGGRLVGRGGVDEGRRGKVLGWRPKGVLVGLTGAVGLTDAAALVSAFAGGLVESLTLAAGVAAGALGSSSGEPQRSSRSSDS